MVRASTEVIRLFVVLYLAGLGYGGHAGQADGLEDTIAFLQGTMESMPSALGEKVKAAFQKVDPADVAGVLGNLGKFASQAMGGMQQQWAMPGVMPGAYGYGQPMFQRAYGQPMFQQLGPASFSQPMYQPRQPMYSPMPMQQMQPVQPMQQQWQVSGAAPWQMQGGLMNGGGGMNFQDPAVMMQQQVQAARDAAEGAMAEGLAKVKATSKRRQRDLAMVHVPCNFGHAIERVALMAQDTDQLYLDPSFGETDKSRQQMYINMAQGPGGEAWGMMAPDLRKVSEKTGCDLYYTPQRYWPEAAARKYFRYTSHENRTVFGMLRDPYDRIVNEFRKQVAGTSVQFAHESRKAISEREGTVDRESPDYQGYYDTCDVNGWVKAELRKYSEGSRFRGNCHLLPQAEFFKGIHGISIPIDNRLIPNSFNEVMKNHGYDIQMTLTSQSPSKCDISAWSLDEEAKQLIRDVYAEDFSLVCKHFGYCGREELTCIKQISHMCGGSPHAD